MSWSQAGTSFVLLVVIGMSLYLGVGGMERVELIRQAKEAAKKPASDGTFSYGGETFSSKEALAVARNEERVERLFPWIGLLTSLASLALTAGAFGVLGGAARVVKELVIDSKPLDLKEVVLNPLFGFLVGIMLLGISYVLPAALTDQEDVQLTPTTLLFLCFFGGLFSRRVFTWVESLIERVFPPP